MQDLICDPKSLDPQVEMADLAHGKESTDGTGRKVCVRRWAVEALLTEGGLHFG